MNLELILWILAGIVVSEIIFILWYKKECKQEEDSDGIRMNWMGVKIGSFLIGSFFTFTQYMIICWDILNEVEGTIVHYEYLLYELAIFLVIGLFFLINKSIANKIESQNKK